MLLVYSILVSKKELMPLELNRESAINQLKSNMSVNKPGIVFITFFIIESCLRNDNISVM